jgi:hypothetical protein
VTPVARPSFKRQLRKSRIDCLDPTLLAYDGKPDFCARSAANCLTKERTCDGGYETRVSASSKKWFLAEKPYSQSRQLSG